MEDDLKTLVHNVVRSFELVGKDVEIIKDKLSITKRDLAKLEVNSSSFHDEIAVLKHELLSLKSEINKLRDLESHLLDNFKMINSKLDTLHPKKEIIVHKITKVKRAKKYFIAGKSSGKLHLEDCVFGKKLKRNNKIIFNSKAKAFKKGFKPCVCMKK